MQKPERKETNGEFAKGNKPFQTACGAVDLQPTARQASKFRLGKGKAYRKGRNKS